MSGLTHEQIWGEPESKTSMKSKYIPAGFIDELESDSIKKAARELINRPEGLSAGDIDFLKRIAALERLITIAEREMFLSIE